MCRKDDDMPNQITLSELVAEIINVGSLLEDDVVKAVPAFCDDGRKGYNIEVHKNLNNSYLTREASPEYRILSILVDDNGNVVKPNPFDDTTLTSNLTDYVDKLLCDINIIDDFEDILTDEQIIDIEENHAWIEFVPNRKCGCRIRTARRYLGIMCFRYDES